MTVPRKEKKRESRREEKALKAAQIENVLSLSLCYILRNIVTFFLIFFTNTSYWVPM